MENDFRNYWQSIFVTKLIQFSLMYVFKIAS